MQNTVSDIGPSCSSQTSLLTIRLVGPRIREVSMILKKRAKNNAVQITEQKLLSGSAPFLCRQAFEVSLSHFSQRNPHPRLNGK